MYIISTLVVKVYLQGILKMEEIWKDVIGYEGLYKVSNLGRVRSLNRNVTDKNGTSYTLIGTILKQNKCGDYLRVSLWKDGIIKGKLVHRLVAEAFISNPDNLPVVNHKDEDKWNNNLDNLEWCTQSYNALYSKSSIRKDTSPIGKKIVLKIAQDGSTIERYKSIKEAARSNKIDTKFLHSVIKGNRILDGFIWIELAT